MGQAQWDAIKLKIPAKIGDVIHKIALARWSRTFSGLVHAACRSCRRSRSPARPRGTSHLERAMDDVRDSVQQGGTIAEPLRKQPDVPTMVAHMVGVGEETGNLDGMLAKIADFYEDEVAAV